MQRYEFSDGKSNKFWQVKQAGSELHIAWGKIGTAGQSQVKGFDDVAQAQTAQAKLVAEKTKKGYVLAGAAPMPQPIPPQVAASADAQHEARTAAPASTAAVATREPLDTSPAPDSARPDAEVVPEAGPAAPLAADIATVADASHAPDAQRQLNAWLAERRATPGFDQRLLAAWRQLLTEVAAGDLSVLDPAFEAQSKHRMAPDDAAARASLSALALKMPTAAQLKKRFALDDAAARVMLTWLEQFRRGDDLQTWSASMLVPVAQALLAEPRLAEAEAAAAHSHAAQWADLAPGDAAQRDDARWGAGAGRALPLFHIPVWPDAEAARRALNELFRRTNLERFDAEASDDDFAPVIQRVRERQRLHDPLDAKAGLEADAEADAVLLALSFGNHVLLAPWFIHRDGLPGYVALLLEAARIVVHNHWRTSRFHLTRDTANLDRQLGLPVPGLAYVRELLRQAQAETRAQCEQLLLAGLPRVPVALRQHMAMLLPESQALVQAVLAEPELDWTEDAWLLLSCELDEATRARLEPHRGRWSGWLERTAWVSNLARVHAGADDVGTHPDALTQALEAVDGKERQQAIEVCQARAPLAMLIAATRVALGGGRQAPLAQGMVRSMLADLAPGLVLVRPWLTPAAWRWLQVQAQPQAAIALADAAELPPVLANPPWRQKTARAGRTVLTLQGGTVPAPALNWPAPSEPGHAAKVLTDPAKMASLLAVSHRDKGPHLSACAQAIRAGDMTALLAAWREGREQAVSRGEHTYLFGNDLLRLPPEVGVPFWNAVAGEITIWYWDDLIAHWGEAALPGVLAQLRAFADERANHWLHVGSTALAIDSARMGLRAKAPAQRLLGQQWLLAWPRHAAAGLVPVALGPDGAEQADAAAALRFMAAQAGAGLRELLLAQAASHGHPDAEHALIAVLDADPLALYPSKIGRLPEFWQPQQWQRPVLATGPGAGKGLPDAAVEALGQMLSFPRPAGAYAGLGQVIATCTRDSLSAFAWDLFSAWLAAGAPAKDNWAFSALGVLGDDHAVHRLAPLMKAWPTEGGSARASLGLLVMSELGSDSALRLVADLGAEKMPKGMRAKAQAALQQAADERGLSLDDLQDRLVPDLGLDDRGQTTLDYGPRQFLLSFDENLKPWLRKLEGGKPGARIRSLPARNAADDPDQAQAASERYKAIKAQTEGVAKVQRVRLEQAMVAGRRWSREDFETLYVRQPLLRQLAARLIWGIFADETGGADASAVQAGNVRGRPERLLQVVRLADDGELSTADDEPWDWPEAQTRPARVGIVHPLELSEAERAAFGQLLADYELMQPFEQLARWLQPAVAPDGRAALVGQLTAPGRQYAPMRLLAFKTRGWSLHSDDGYGFSGATRELGPTWRVQIRVAPGVDTYDLRNAPPQTLAAVAVYEAGTAQGKPGGDDWARLDAVAFSEFMRDMAYLAL